MIDPLGAIYGAVTKLRNRSYDTGLIASSAVGLPVISVGNVVVGGSGKSPFTDFVCQQVLNLGARPTILLRGYGGAATGPTVVSASSRAEQVGDEAVMHWAHFGGQVPVVASRSRVAGADLICRQGLGDMIVLDDGFQHRALKRDLDLVLADLSEGTLEDYVEKSRLLPFGRFREDCRSAFQRADAIIAVRRWPALVTRRGNSEAQFQQKLAAPVWEFELRPQCFKEYTRIKSSADPNVSGSRAFSDGLLSDFSIRTISLEALKGVNVAVLSAIATSRGFRHMLDNLELRIVNERHYRDHHQYGRGELERFQRPGSTLLTTAKDAAKLLPTLECGERLTVLELRGAFRNEAEHTEFVNILKSLLRL